MNLQERYWNNMVQSYFQCIYVDMCYEQSVKIDRYINIFLAIISCSSIAGWAIWSQFALIWAIAVATSQVINSLKPIIPYSKRIEELFKYKYELYDISRELEFNWHGVASGQYTSNEVNELINKAKSESNAISQKYLNKDYISNKPIYKESADRLTEAYFQNNF